MRPAGERAPAVPQDREAEETPENAAPPDEAQGLDLPDGTRMEDGDWPYAPSPHSDADWEDLAYFGDEMDEDLTDAAAPPRSAYVGFSLTAVSTRSTAVFYSTGLGRT